MCQKLISSTLIVALLNILGCYSYSTIPEEETRNNLLFPNESIRILLNDGSEIFYKPNKTESLTKWDKINKTIFLKVKEPSDLMLGAGILYDYRSKEESIFKGIVERGMIDSTKSTFADNSIYDIYWLKDSTRIVFRSNEYFNITPEDGIGYWIKGERNYKDFGGKIEFDDVNEIHKQSTIISSTAVTIGLAVIATGLFIFLLSGIKGGAKGCEALGSSTQKS